MAKKLNTTNNTMKRINLFNKKKDMSQNKEHDFQEENQDKPENVEGLFEDADENTNNESKEKIQDTDDEASKLEEELHQARDKYVRLVAEFDNFRKRTAKEKSELIKSAGEDIIASLLDVLDDAERAEKQMEKSDDLEALKAGVNLIFNKLHKSLKSRGLSEMKSIGTEFNPELHDAITEIPAGKEDQVGKVMDEVQKGYYLNDKIIRHAKVVVGK